MVLPLQSKPRKDCARKYFRRSFSKINPRSADNSVLTVRKRIGPTVFAQRAAQTEPLLRPIMSRYGSIWLYLRQTGLRESRLTRFVSAGRYSISLKNAMP